MSSIKYITPEEVEARYTGDRNILLVDLRPPIEYRQVHVPRSLLISQQNLGTVLTREHTGSNNINEVYLLCRNGKNARRAAVQSVKLGLMDIYVIEGGIQAWEAAGLPVIRRRHSFTSEHRVRVAAGGFVLAGTILGLLVNPLYWFVPAIVGAVLIVTGLADALDPFLCPARRRR